MNRLPSNRKRKTIAAIIISLVVVAIVVAVILCSTILVDLNKKITQITISSVPTKTVYYVNDAFDPSGIKIEAVYNNGSRTVVDLSQCTISGFDSSKASEAQEITIRYKSYKVVFNVIIKDVPRLLPKLTQIYIQTMPKTEYKVGERLNTSGGQFVCEYSDGSITVFDLTNNYVYGWEMVDGPGTYELTVYYVENGDMASCTYTITVTE